MLLTSALDGVELLALASRPGRITPEEKASGTHWIGGWVGYRTGQDAVARRRNLRPCRELNLGRPARGLITILTELP